MTGQQKAPSSRDPFRLLAYLAIVLGMAIVAGGCVYWVLTGRSSDLIFGAGVTLTIGGPLSDRFSEAVRRLAELAYYSSDQRPRDRREDGDEP
jgi:hypothetical protein